MTPLTSLAQHVTSKQREIIPIRSSPSSPKSRTATQLVPTTWPNSEMVEIVSHCFIMFHTRAANQLATCLPRKTILVDLAKAFTCHMHPHAHSDQTQYVGPTPNLWSNWRQVACPFTQALVVRHVNNRHVLFQAQALSVGALLSLAEHSEHSERSPQFSTPF